MLSEGTYVLRSNISDWSLQELWEAYMQLTEAENAFRIQKSQLSIRPVWHQKTERVEGHILVCFLAYVLWKTLAGWQQRARLGSSPRTLLEEFRRIQSVGAMLLSIAASGWLGLFCSAGEDASLYLRFVCSLLQYQAVVADILERGAAERETTSLDKDCCIDEGPPIRIAFSWGGVMDNWVGAVYDPTGIVLRSREFKSDWSNWDDPSLSSVRGLFGGDLRWAQHLWGNWYYCVFT